MLLEITLRWNDRFTGTQTLTKYVYHQDASEAALLAREDAIEEGIPANVAVVGVHPASPELRVAYEAKMKDVLAAKLKNAEADAKARIDELVNAEIERRAQAGEVEQPDVMPETTKRAKAAK